MQVASAPRVVILFPDDWTPFSPTLTRLVETLEGRADVVVFSFDTGRFSHTTLDPHVYRAIRICPAAAWALRKSGLWRVLRPVVLAWAARRAAAGASTLVAVDGGGAVAATLLRRRFHFLSLEIARWSPARWLVPRFGRSIAIQSHERLAFQFDRAKLAGIPVCFVQNAPAFDDPVPAPRGRSGPPVRLVYMGNLLPDHGLTAMLELVAHWPEATLMLRGPASSGVMGTIERARVASGGRVELSEGFLDEARITAFLAGFDIGLCLYDVDKLRGDFNYLSAPAGKMFNYFAAGLPVLASAMPGLKPVSDFDAGEQAESNHPTVLRAAAERILERQAEHRNGALRAARHFDFTVSSRPWLDRLLEAR